LALTKEDVKAIKKQIVRGDRTQDQIAEVFGVTRGTISAIARDKVHTDVPWPKPPPPKKPPSGQRKKLPDYDPTNERIMVLESEVAHLTEERNHARRAAKANSRYMGLFKAATEVIEERMIQPLKPLPKARRLKKDFTVEEDLVLHLSDGHHDLIVTAIETGGLEEYNFPISCARAERLIDTTIQYTQLHLSNYKFRNLWILANGDHTSGEIHGHEKRSYFRNQFNNSLAIGQLHSLMIRDLAPYFEQINCVYVPGNHGRRTLKKDHYGAHENWDYLVAKTAELHLKNVDNINFLIPNAFTMNLDINGVGFHICHGDDIRSNLGVPFYGMVRRQSKLMALNNITTGTRIRYFCMGHHHVAAALADLDGELLVNGAWPANDQFSYNSFGGYREPCQLLHGVHPKYGVTWRMLVQMKHEAEKKGPTRYKVEI
jgi:hypothetical protein